MKTDSFERQKEFGLIYVFLANRFSHVIYGISFNWTKKWKT